MWQESTNIDEARKEEGGKARRWLKKHLTNKDGSLACEIVDSDRQGPKTIRYLNIMTNHWSTWRRISSRDGDILFELEGSFD